MKLQTINKTHKALENLEKAVELEMCVLDTSDKKEYEEYFKEIENAISKVQDKFFKEWIYNNQVTKKTAAALDDARAALDADRAAALDAAEKEKQIKIFKKYVK